MITCSMTNGSIPMEEQKSLNPKAPRFASLFNPARVIREQEARIVLLEAERADLIKLPPEKALKTLALQLFREGSYDMAMTYSEAALKLDPGIFNSVDITVPNLDDTDRLEEISVRLPLVNILIVDPVTESSKSLFALYYVLQAKRKLEEKRVFSALRLFERALSCDEKILENDPGLLPKEVELFPVFLFDIENKFGDKITTICQFGYDYIGLPGVFFSLGNVTIEPLLLDHTDGLEIIKDFKGYESQPEDKSKAFLAPLVNLLCALGYVNALKWAIRDNHNTHVLDFMGVTALTWAILFGRIEIVEYLVVNGIVYINNTMTNKETPSLI